MSYKSKNLTDPLESLRSCCGSSKKEKSFYNYIFNKDWIGWFEESSVSTLGLVFKLVYTFFSIVVWSLKWFFYLYQSHVYYGTKIASYLYANLN